MDDRRAQASKYRDRAEEVRNIADVVKGDVAKRALREVASGYEKLARHHERISQAEKKVRHAAELLSPPDGGVDK